MKSNSPTTPFLILLFVLFQLGLSAQDTTEKSFLISLSKRGGELVGLVTKESSDSIWIEVKDAYNFNRELDKDEIGLRKDQVRSIELYDYNGRYDYWDRNIERNFFSPTARPIPRGTANYQNVMITGHILNIGFTRYFSVSAGFETLSLALEQEPIFYFRPKFSFDVNDKLSLGVGVMSGGLLDIYDLDFELETFVALPYANLTYGTDDRNVTIGIGSGMEFEFRNKNLLAAQIAGNFRIHERIVITSENSIFMSNEIERDRSKRFYAGIHGVKILRTKSTFDFAITIGLENDGDSNLFFFPYFGYTRYFQI